MKKNFAFTLAEVLITLTIIGVIAALTIPTIMKKYSNYTVVSQLKKAQSTLAQATTAIVAEQGPVNEWPCGPLNANNQCVDWYFQKLKLQCDGRGALDAKGIKGNASWQNRCKFPANEDLKALNGTAGINDASSFWLWTASYPARTTDGMIYGFVFGNWALRSASSLYGVSRLLGNEEVKMTVFVDINGNKGPNQTGRDIFPFAITRLGVIPFGNVPDMAQYPCTTSNTVEYYHSGFSCTGKVLREGGIFY